MSLVAMFKILLKNCTQIGESKSVYLLGFNWGLQFARNLCGVSMLTPYKQRANCKPWF